MGPDAESRVIVERVTTGRGELQLQRRGRHYEIIFNGCFLMATHGGASERALIRAALRLAPHARTVLIGGLGVGYTLRAALDAPGMRRVTVVEIEPKIIEWNRTVLAPFSGHALSDPRVHLVEADLLDFLAAPARAHGAQAGEEAGPYDVVALDTDNGPDWLVLPGNERLWRPEGLALVRRRLAPGGAAVFWASRPSPAFEKVLRSEFAHVEVLAVPLGDMDGGDIIFAAAYGPSGGGGGASPGPAPGRPAPADPLPPASPRRESS